MIKKLRGVVGLVLSLIVVGPLLVHAEAADDLALVLAEDFGVDRAETIDGGVGDEPIVATRDDRAGERAEAKAKPKRSRETAVASAVGDVRAGRQGREAGTAGGRRGVERASRSQARLGPFRL